MTPMKKMILLAALTLGGLAAGAKSVNDTLYVTTTPPMHCEDCEMKVKRNLRFEKGVREIQTDIKKQRVMVVYNPKKTTRKKLIDGFKKFGYKAREVTKEVTTDKEQSLTSAHGS
jgi:copper chaperone CopZ